MKIGRLQNCSNDYICLLPRKESKDGRYRTFVGMMYPDSRPDDWREILQNEFMIPYYISPVHSPEDDDTDEDRSKKQHYHIVLDLDNRVDPEVPAAVFSAINCAKKFEVVIDKRAQLRYLCHLDQPLKEQGLLPSDVEQFCVKKDYLEIISSESDELTVIAEMMEFCNSQGVYSFSKLCMYAKEERRDWFRALAKYGAIIMREFLRSSYFDCYKDEYSSH